MKSVKSINRIKSVLLTKYDLVTKEHEGTLSLQIAEEEGLLAGQAGTKFIITISLE